MDFFEFLFGKKEDKNVSSQSSSSVNNCKSESTIKSVLQSEAPSMDPIEQYVKESVTDLKKHMPLNTKDLEAEAIYLAAYLYLKGSYQIDFELDYFSEGLIDKIPSRNFNVADKVFSYMVKYGEGHYGVEERRGPQGQEGCHRSRRLRHARPVPEDLYRCWSGPQQRHSAPERQLR